MEDFQNHGGGDRPVSRHESEVSFGREPVPEGQCGLGAERRMHRDRRRRHADGYMWISTVGWICRRENRRRGEDPDPFGC